MRKLAVLLIIFAVVVPVFLSLLAVALYVMTAPASVTVTVNPPGGFNVGPGWNFP